MGSNWSWTARCQAIFHLGGYLIHPLLLLLLLISLPLTLLGSTPLAIVGYLGFFSFGPPLLYALSQYYLHRGRWVHQWAYLPLLTLFGTGLCLNNTVAVVQGLTGVGGQFLRTPKFRIQAADDGWRGSSYRLPVPPIVYVEAGLSIYALGVVALNVWLDKWWPVPFLLLYAAGFAVMVVVGLWQGKRPRHTPRRRTTGHPRDRRLRFKRDHVRV